MDDPSKSTGSACQRHRRGGGREGDRREGGRTMRGLHLAVFVCLVQENHWRRKAETAAQTKLRDAERRQRWRARRQFREQLEARERREEKRRQAREANDAEAAA